jgi:hypothetical protein
MSIITATPDLVAAQSPEPPAEGVDYLSGTKGLADGLVLDLDLDPLVATLTARTTGADVPSRCARLWRTLLASSAMPGSAISCRC